MLRDDGRVGYVDDFGRELIRSELLATGDSGRSCHLARGAASFETWLVVLDEHGAELRWRHLTDDDANDIEAAARSMLTAQ